MWPGFFPENCPPNNANEHVELIYRALASETPTESDFMSFQEKNPNKTYENPCIACGLSVFDSLVEIRRVIEVSPLLKKKPR